MEYKRRKNIKYAIIEDFVRTIEDNIEKIQTLKELIASQKNKLLKSKTYLENVILNITMKTIRKRQKIYRELC